jgi:hypothetical protein
MNTGQTILTVGAIVLLGLTILTVNRTSLQHGTILTATKVGIYAISMGLSRIEDASGNHFDAMTVNNSYNDPTLVTQMTAVNALGPEAGENPDSTLSFNDFDDYNLPNHPARTWIPGVDSIIVKSTVVYVDPTTPNTTSGAQTWSKKMTVSVTAPSMSDTVKMQYIYSYFYFR